LGNAHDEASTPTALVQMYRRHLTVITAENDTQVCGESVSLGRVSGCGARKSFDDVPRSWWPGLVLPSDARDMRHRWVGDLGDVAETGAAIGHPAGVTGMPAAPRDA
jgi:hypothetical protein